MSQPFVGEIRIFPYTFVPLGWRDCDGSLLSIAEFETLFTLIGTIYGGDGQATFAVPDLRGRLPLHQGHGGGLSNRIIGEVAGSEAVTLNAAQLAGHSHALQVTTAAATGVTPGTEVMPGAVSADTFYVTDITGATAIPMAANSTTAVGGSTPHDNTMPTLAVRCCISLGGVFPPLP